jgi:hypothetical protein
MQDYVQYISLLRVGIPALFNFGFAKLLYPIAASTLAVVINDSGVFAVVAQDASQYIQNILTTSGLVFSLLVGYTYYFMYQQQEATYLALYQEVTMAKSLLEQGQSLHVVMQSFLLGKLCSKYIVPFVVSRSIFQSH